MRPAIVVLAFAGLLLSALGVAARYVRLPYDSIAPGESRSLDGVVVVQGHPSYPPRGRILSTTVNLRAGVNPFEALAGWIDPDVDLLPQRDIRGDVPPAEFERMNEEAMADSKSTAKVLALRQLGFRDLGAGAEIVTVEPGHPASPLLRSGDVIVEVDGAPVRVHSEAIAAIGKRQPGDVARLKLARDGEPERTVDAVLDRNDRGGALLGVRLTTKVELPFDIAIDSQGVVGPSAGLAYALELLDLLTPGELTGGAAVAVTGELAPDGRVGPVGGVAQKAVAARRAGAKVFLVPRENVVEATSHAGAGLQVRAVGSFSDAIDVLGGLTGSNALALGRPSPGA